MAIGPVTLMEGNCLELVLEHDLVADHVIADPPYEAILHEAKSSGTIQRVNGREADGALDFEPIDEIREQYVALFEGRIAGWFINFCTIEGVARWQAAINASRMKYKRSGTWHKTDYKPQMNGQGPAFSLECLVAAWAGRGHSRWNAGGRDIHYPHFHYDMPSKGPTRHGAHKCEKPLPLLQQLLLDFTQPGELVIDPFMGSGSMALACLATGRRFIGIELQSHYFDVSVERVRAFKAAPQLFDPFEKPEQVKLPMQMPAKKKGPAHV